MTVLRRHADGVPAIWCDPCLAPLVMALNGAGLRTLASCCGHEHAPSRVTLADGRTVFLVNAEWEGRISTLVHDIAGCKVGHECSTCARNAES